MQQLALALGDLRKDALAAVDLLLREGDAVTQVLGDRVADSLSFGAAEPNGGVVLLDGGLDEVDGLVALRALTALVLGTDEVFIGAAVAFVPRVNEMAAAVATADGGRVSATKAAISLRRLELRQAGPLE